MPDKWDELCEAVRCEAARCGAVSPSRAHSIREAAAAFTRQPKPDGEDQLAERRLEANSLRRQWFAEAKAARLATRLGAAPLAEAGCPATQTATRGQPTFVVRLHAALASALNGLAALTSAAPSARQ
jgi:hypothetical protein